MILSAFAASEARNRQNLPATYSRSQRSTRDQETSVFVLLRRPGGGRSSIPGVACAFGINRTTRVPETTPGHNLALRRRDHRHSVLRFTRDSRIPPTNKLAEPGVRPEKVQQKIAGSCRSRAGATNRTIIRTVLATARKQGWNMLDTLRRSPHELSPHSSPTFSDKQRASFLSVGQSCRSMNPDQRIFQVHSD